MSLYPDSSLSWRSKEALASLADLLSFAARPEASGKRNMATAIASAARPAPSHRRWVLDLMLAFTFRPPLVEVLKAFEGCPVGALFA